jgi:hypothetical protein
MLYRDITVCSNIPTRHTNGLYGQNVELLNVKLLVHKITTRFQRNNDLQFQLYCSCFLRTVNVLLCLFVDERFRVDCANGKRHEISLNFRE